MQKFAESALRKRLELGLVGLSCVLFAASFGFNWGVDNQVVYFLKSLTLVERGLLRSDWYTSHTTQYHPTFAYLGALLLALRHDGWAVAVAQCATIALGAFVIYGLCRALSGVRSALAAFWLLLAVMFVTRTSSVMVSYIFDFILQPSTLGSLGLLGAMYYFVEERWLASGICLACSGAFHVNYLVLGFPAFGLAQLALGPRELWPRLKWQLAPLFLVALAVSPMLRASASSHPGALQAQEILFNVRSPHHYAPAAHERNFMMPAAYSLIGIGAGWPLLRSPVGKRVGALLAGLSAVVWAGTLLTTWVFIPRVAQLFVWRFAPFMDLLNQLLAAVALAQLIDKPARAKLYPPALVAVCFVGIAILCLFMRTREDAPLPKLALAYFGLALLVRALDLGLTLAARWLPAPPLGGARRALALSAVPLALAALTFEARPLLASIPERSTLLKSRTDSTWELYGWLANSSPRDAVFLTPPDIDGMRLHGKRAIVVDWKAAPILPRDLLEWHARLSAVCGHNVTSFRDMSGYPTLPAAQVLELAHRYGASFVIERRQHAGRLSDLEIVYQNGGYVVLKVPGSS